jgi:hypothetical protein
MPTVKKAATDQTFYFMLVDSAAGTPESDYTITNLDITYVRDRKAAVKADATALSTVSDAHTDNTAIQVSKTTAPGLYRVDFPDAAFSDSATIDRVQLVVTGTGLAPAVIEVDLEKYDVSDVYEYVSDVKSEVTKIYSDTTAIYSDTTAIHSDTTIIASDVVLLYSDTTAIHSDTTIIASDVVLLYSDTTAIHSDTTAIHSDTTAIHSDTTAVHSDTTIIASDVVLLYSDTTVLTTGVNVTKVNGSDVTLGDIAPTVSEIVAGVEAGLVSDIYSNVTALTTKVDSDSVLYLADHDKTQSDIADLSTKVNSDSVLYLADHDKTQSDIAEVKSETQAIHDDTGTDGVFLADNAITAAKIANAAIDNATFAADVGSTAYATNIIALAVRKALDELNLDHLMKVAVASGADMTTEVADGTVLSNLMTATGDTSDYDRSTDSLENQYDTSAWTLNTVTATGVVLADNAIAAAKIATGAITAAKFAAGAINDAAIATDAITAAKIAANAIAASKIATDAITASKIAANAITVLTIADGAIDADTFTSDALAAFQSECNDALIANNLDHLMKTAVASGADMTTEVEDGTVLSNLMTATGDTSDYDRSTDSLEAAGDTTAAIKATTDKLDSMVEEIT